MSAARNEKATSSAGAGAPHTDAVTPSTAQPGGPRLSGQAAGGDAAAGRDQPRVAATVARSRDEYLIAQTVNPMIFDPLGPLSVFSAGPQFTALSNAQFSAMADHLSGADIEVLDKIMPAVFTAFGGPAAGPTPSPIIVARMTDEKARQIEGQLGGGLVVAKNLPLRLAETDFFAGMNVVDPSVIHSVSERFAFTVQVVGDNTAPLANAEVFVYGTTTSTQAVTGANGQASFSLATETSATIRGIMVQPASGYWNVLIRNPQLTGNAVNTIQVQPLSSTFPNLSNTDILGWGQKAMRLDHIDPSLRGQGVRIAIIDSGAANGHPDLTGIKTGYDFPNKNPNTWTNDTLGHGSHCAGIICGRADNNFGIRGFAPEAEVHALRILPEGRPDDLIRAIQYCIDNSIDVANLSLGGIAGDPDDVQKLKVIIEPYLTRAKATGVACIIAAGNASGPVLYPGSSPNALTVSAIGKLGQFPPNSYHASLPIATQPDGFFFPRFSCFGPEVAVAGPGVAILSSVPGNAFVTWDGTSMATPHITGLAALVLAHHRDFQSTFNLRNAARVDHLFAILKQSAQPLNLGGPARTGAGLPDVPTALGLAALANIAVPAGPRPTPQPAAPTISAIPGGTLTAAQIAEISQKITDALHTALSR
jgi:subtilisin